LADFEMGESRLFGWRGSDPTARNHSLERGTVHPPHLAAQLVDRPAESGCNHPGIGIVDFRPTLDRTYILS
jgi:hypothetical protein